MKFEYYVLNCNANSRKTEMYNIFQNSYVQKQSEKEVRRYLRAPSKYKGRLACCCKDTIGFEALCDEIETIIKFEEHNRAEYEIAAGDLFNNNLDTFDRWDCYEQCKPNIPTIVREIIYQYKMQVRK